MNPIVGSFKPQTIPIAREAARSSIVLAAFKQANRARSRQRGASYSTSRVCTGSRLDRLDVLVVEALSAPKPSAPGCSYRSGFKRPVAGIRAMHIDKLGVESSDVVAVCHALRCDRARTPEVAHEPVSAHRSVRNGLPSSCSAFLTLVSVSASRMLGLRWTPQKRLRAG